MMRDMSDEEVDKYKELMSQLFYQVPADIKQKVFDVVSYINGIKDFDKALDMYDVIRWKMTITIDWKKFNEPAT